MIIKIYRFAPWAKYLQQLGLSDRQAAIRAKMSRITWKKLTGGRNNVEVENLGTAMNSLGLTMAILGLPPNVAADFSTVATGYKILRDGTASWKIHCMNFVDEFRREADPRLIILPPPVDLPMHLRALLASIVVALCHEAGMDVPDWAQQRFDLSRPWFVSEMESLKASALLESPLPFRRNGIFVNSNFLKRA